ncbi:hypothetical protein MMC27_004483 [Xylographa pallens]|nr:hypothetical protein [Xylographa pallens]
MHSEEVTEPAREQQHVDNRQNPTNLKARLLFEQRELMCMPETPGLGARRMMKFSSSTAECPNVKEWLKDDRHDWIADHSGKWWHLDVPMPGPIPVPMIGNFPVQPSMNSTPFNAVVIANLMFQLLTLVYWARGEGEILLLTPERCDKLIAWNSKMTAPLTAAVMEMICLMPYSLRGSEETNQIAPETMPVNAPADVDSSEEHPHWHPVERDLTALGHILPPHMMFLTWGQLYGTYLILDTKTGMIIQYHGMYSDYAPHEVEEGCEVVLTHIEGTQAPAEEVLREWINNYLSMKWIVSPGWSIAQEDSYENLLLKKVYQDHNWPRFPPRISTRSIQHDNGTWVEEEITFYNALEEAYNEYNKWTDDNQRESSHLLRLIDAIQTHERECTGSDYGVLKLYNHFTNNQDNNLDVIRGIQQQLQEQQRFSSDAAVKVKSREMKSQAAEHRKLLIDNGLPLLGKWRMDKDNTIKDFEEDERHRWMWRAEGAADGMQGYFQRTNLQGVPTNQNIERGAFWLIGRGLAEVPATQHPTQY